MLPEAHQADGISAAHGVPQLVWLSFPSGGRGNVERDGVGFGWHCSEVGNSAFGQSQELLSVWSMETVLGGETLTCPISFNRLCCAWAVTVVIHFIL